MAVTWKEIAYADHTHGASDGLFEIDVDGGLMPITDTGTDNYYELDVDDNIQPLEA